MALNSETVKRLLDMLMDLSKEVAIQAHKYLESHTRIRGYCKYPVKYEIFPKDEPKYAEHYQKIPYLIYEIQKYELKDFPEDKVQYGAIFNGYNEERIDITQSENYCLILDFINSNPELIRLMVDKDKTENLKYTIRNMTCRIVERYLYSISATPVVPDDINDKLTPFIKESLSRYLNPNLEIDIYVPICLATFEDDTIKLSEQVEIVRIPDDIQKSRQQKCSYEIINDDWAASCATHMIAIHGYSFKNEKFTYIDSIANDYHAYPLSVIDDIMAVIRIITGYAIGYKQLLSRPLNWIDSFCADLTPLYGAKARFVNENEINGVWMMMPVSKISKEQALEIQKIYSSVLLLKDNKNKGHLSFALKRLNRCLLREENDDMAIDATIGLEALLSGGTKSELRYTISNRIPVVFAYERNSMFTPQNCRDIMKKIYDYRSSIVHGITIKEKDKFYNIDDSKIEIDKIAVDFLRYTLLFMLHNPEYLDATKFDKFIDQVVSGDKE